MVRSFIRALPFTHIATAVFFILLFAAPSYAVTVQEVASELECPCACPLVLEDCNMSCGLEWKEQIGEQIKAGKTKEEIVAAFINKYGDEARITPYKRLRGKVFQYTRGFDTKDWVILGGGIAVWVLVMFFGVFLITKKLFPKKSGDGEKRN